jgi:hypothetical protein
VSISKKDFVALANHISIIGRESAYCEQFTTKQIEYLADFCQSQNPRFNRERWLAYIAGECGPSGGKVGK